MSGLPRRVTRMVAMPVTSAGGRKRPGGSWVSTAVKWTVETDTNAADIDPQPSHRRVCSKSGWIRQYVENAIGYFITWLYGQFWVSR
jgi:hypothetical protein